MNGLADLVSRLLAYDGVADDADDALVGRELLPAHIPQTATDGCGLERRTRTLQRLLRMQEGLSSGLHGGFRPASGPFGGLAAQFQD